jgi:hypothetical protein
VAAVPGRRPHASEPTEVRLCGLVLAVQDLATPANPKKDVMQFFIALGILVAASSAYLVREFWSRSLSIDDAPPPDVASADADATPGRLKAA